MKKIYTLIAACIFASAAIAQVPDTAYVVTIDTMKLPIDTVPKKQKIFQIGIIVFGKKGVDSPVDSLPKKPSKVKTDYFVFDIGFSSYSDNTNYAAASNYLVNKPGSPNFSSNDFKLKNGKSINVNIWIIMQQLALVKQNVHLKYGLGLELNNYRYKQALSYKEDGSNPFIMSQIPQPGAFIFRDSINFQKNKLALDYLTVPLMLTFGTNKAQEQKGISVGFGISAGYLYSQRNKQKSEERGKERNKGDYDMERFKFSYIGELGLGPVKLYGSYSPKSMYQRELDFRPYTFGIRINEL